MPSMYGAEMVNLAEYNKQKVSRVLDADLKTGGIYIAFLKLRAPHSSAICDRVPALPSTVELAATQSGKLAVNLVILNDDFKPVAKREGDFSDGIWRPAESSEGHLEFDKIGVTVEGFFKDYDDGLDLRALIGAAANQAHALVAA